MPCTTFVAARRFLASIVALTAVHAVTACNPLDPYGCDNREPLALDDRALEDGAVGVAYDAVIVDAFFNDVAPATEGDALPPGLAIEEVDGRFRLRGTPTEAGTFTFTLEATEPSTQCSGLSDTFDVTVEIAGD
jgi:hypothetical protein